MAFNWFWRTSIANALFVKTSSFFFSWNLSLLIASNLYGSWWFLEIILSFCLSFFNFNDKENSQSDDLVSFLASLELWHRCVSSIKKCRFVLCRIFSDVAGDVTIYVDGQSFLLHKVYILKLALQTYLDIVFHNFLFNFCILLSKFPLVSRSGKIWKMVVESREPDLSRLELHEEIWLACVNNFYLLWIFIYHLRV